MTNYCTTCWRTFEHPDWRLDVHAQGRTHRECADCRMGRVTLEQRQRGFLDAMRMVGTETLTRWAQSATPSRRDAARMILEERKQERQAKIG